MDDLPPSPVLVAPDKGVGEGIIRKPGPAGDKELIGRSAWAGRGKTARFTFTGTTRKPAVIGGQGLDIKAIMERRDNERTRESIGAIQTCPFAGRIGAAMH